MKYRLALGSIMLGLSASSFAQSGVTLYGLMDTGVELVTHANAAGKSVVRMPAVTGEFPSRWGIRGSEDLGGGLSTIFKLENGFNVRNGAFGNGGREFGRESWVGLKGSFGAVTFGRQFTMTYWGFLDSDLLGPDIYSGIASFDMYNGTPRSDNTIAYKGTFGGVTVGSTYSFGRDDTGTGNSPGQGTCAQVAGRSQTCSEWSAMVRYDSNGYGVASVYDEQRGGPGAAANFFDGTTPFPITQSGDKDVRIQLNGYGHIGSVKFGGGWLGRRVETVAPATPDVTYNMFYLTAAYNVSTALIVDGGVYRIINSQDDTRGTIAALRANYALSKRSVVYLQTAYLFNSAHAAYTVSGGGGGTTPGVGMGQLGVMVGIRHAF